jgi:hypothetical protein
MTGTAPTPALTIPMITADMSTLDTALALAGSGFPVFPIDHPELPRCAGIGRCDGQRGKHPAVKFTKAATIDPKMITSWFTGPPRNIGIYCADLVVIDEDGPGELDRYAAEHHVTIPDTVIVSTARGQQYYFRARDDHPLGNREGEFGPYNINIRSGNAYVVGPGSMHASDDGVVYMINKAVPPAPVPDWIIDAVDQGRPAEVISDTAGSDWERVTVEQPRGLAAVPAIVRGPRADSGGERHGVLMRYASSLRARSVPYAEAEELFKAIWPRCEQPPVAISALPWADALAKLQDVYSRYPAGPSAEYRTEHAEDPSDTAGEATRPSWAPIDLRPYLDGTYRPVVPTLMPRTDRVCLLYPTLTHSFHGESESGKSLLAQSECARLIMLGQNVLFVDFESDEGSVTERLLMFGATADAILAHFTYIRPEVDPSKSAVESAEWSQTPARKFTLAIIDGVTDSMGTFGYSTKDNDDITAWMLIMPKMIAKRTGAAVVVIDHVTKDPDSRGRFAIGGQAKLSGLTGAAFTVEVAEALGRGLRGAILLRVAKDRPGFIRGHSGRRRSSDGSQGTARIVIDSTGPQVLVSVEPAPGPDSATTAAVRWRPTGLMEKVSTALDLDRPLSFRAIDDQVTGKREHQSGRRAVAG